MFTKKSPLVLALVLGLSAATSQACLLDIHFHTPTVDLSGHSAYSEHVVNDLYISFPGEDRQYLANQLLVDLVEGEIFQHPDGTKTAPGETLIGFVPELAYDTFVTLGGLTSQTSETPSFAGGAINLGGESEATFDTGLVDQAYFAPPPSPFYGEEHFVVARITLSDNATGTWGLLTSIDGEDWYIEGGPIVGGMMVPEPGSLMLLLVGGLMLLYRRRRGG